MTEQLYLTDAYLAEFEAVVTEVDPAEHRVALDRTAFYATGGGQPNDTGRLIWPDEAGSGGPEAGGSRSAGGAVIGVRKAGATIWHQFGAEDDLPPVGASVAGSIDWDRRHQLMRTHTAMHLLCGVIWNDYGTAVTGGNMEPLRGRMDFEFDPLPDGFAARVERMVNDEIAADRPIEVSFLDRPTALADPELIRTKVNLIPESVAEIRVVDIVGLDRQADGGTHVRSTAEVGTFSVVKTESKGKGNKRLRISLSD